MLPLIFYSSCIVKSVTFIQMYFCKRSDQILSAREMNDRIVGHTSCYQAVILLIFLFHQNRDCLTEQITDSASGGILHSFQYLVEVSGT